MKIVRYEGERGGKGNTKHFTVIGPKGRLHIGVTFTFRKIKSKNGVTQKIEYQVDEINTGAGWTKECPDTRDILLRTIGETFEKNHRGKWLESVYNNTAIPVKTPISPIRNSGQPKKLPVKSVFKGVPIVEEGTYEISIQGPTDLLTVTKRRGEQATLRDYLMKGQESVPCAICGRDFSPEHLITAHIKKRSHANEEERRDISIVVPMCVMGCDVLFEGGWIGVKEGRVVRLKSAKTTPAAEGIISGLIDMVISNSYWNHKSEQYFEWHHQFHTSG